MPLNELVLVMQAARLRKISADVIQEVEQAVRRAVLASCDLVLLSQDTYKLFEDWNLDECRDEVRALLES